MEQRWLMRMHHAAYRVFLNQRMSTENRALHVRFHSDRTRVRLRIMKHIGPVVMHTSMGIGAVLASHIAQHLAGDSQRATHLLDSARRHRGEARELLQGAYFAHPRFGITTMNTAEALFHMISSVVRAGLKARIRTGAGDTDEMRRQLDKIPEDGYLAMIAAWMASAEAAGYFRSGDVHIRQVLRKGILEPFDNATPPPNLVRVDVPHSLGDSLRDIDELTHMANYGSLVKIVRVGDTDAAWKRPFVRMHNRATGTKQRWIVEIPGTNHTDMQTTPNPADPETNFQEIFGVESNQRVGVRRAIIDAMRHVGISEPEQLRQQELLLIGHSQGATISCALANEDDLPFRVTTIATAGGPIGRMQVPEDCNVLILRHQQDIIPLFGGVSGPAPSSRSVVVERGLTPPKSGALYYAHAAITYAATADRLWEMTQHVDHGRVADIMNTIRRFYPTQRRAFSEPGRVFIYEIYQDVLDEEER